VLREVGGVFVQWSVTYDETLPADHGSARAIDISRVLPSVPGSYCAGHPATCRSLSQAAEAAGATFVRGVGRTQVIAGSRPTVSYDRDGGSYDLAARLVVGADGRTSAVRAQAGIALHEAPAPHLVSGLLVDGVPSWPQDTFSVGTEGDRMFFVFPQGAQRVRLYTGTAPDQRERYAGPAGVDRFREDFGSLVCLPYAAALAAGTPIGPCATFGGEDTWTNSPVGEGVVLIGDAAGHNNPIIGQGLSLALRDARVLSELLLAAPDWSPEQLTPYAAERAERLRRLRFTAALHAAIYTCFGWPGAERRLRLFARLQNPKDPAQMFVAPPLIGPHRSPEWAFTEEFRAQILD
jgi:2-polyprenyl-6-methoxyphenol hydroxylase-like FAD-dependent oxidoreductase